MSPNNNETIFDDAVRETEQAQSADAVAVAPGRVAIPLDAERFNAMELAKAIDAGEWNAAFIANKLTLTATGLEMLGQYLLTTGMALRERAMQERARVLQEQTDAWRAAGSPGAFAVPGTPKPIESWRKNSETLASIRAMFEEDGSVA